MKIVEVVIDNLKGAGATPNNNDIYYLGIKVSMKPSIFLELAQYASRNDLKNIDGLKNFIKDGGAIGSPWLDIRIPNSWQSNDYSQPAVVCGHEGRNRISAVKELEGDEPIEVHLFFPRYKARHLTPEILKHINQKLYKQGTSYDYNTGEIKFPLIYKPIIGPFFTIIT